MTSQKIILLIVFNIIVITSSGCGTKTVGTKTVRTIDSDAIQATVNEPMGLNNLPLKKNQEIVVSTRLGTFVGMKIIEVDRTTITGIEMILPNYEITGNIVEVKLEDIVQIGIENKSDTSPPISDNNLPVEQFEGSSPWNSCEIGTEALDAIYEAAANYVNRRNQASARWNQDSAAWDLIDEAEKAGNFPECDSARAKILAEKAIEMMTPVADREISDKEPLIPSEQDSDSDQGSCVVSGDMEKEIFHAYDFVGKENPEAIDLVYEAYAIAGPPECDTTKANVLIGIATEHAKRTSIGEDKLTEESEGSGRSETKTSQKHMRIDPWDCEKLLPTRTGEEISATDVLLDLGSLPLVTTVAPFWTVVMAGCLTGNATTATTNMGKDESAELQRIFYVHATRDKLARDISRGTGEYLDSLAYLHGCPVETHARYAKVSQQNFARIFTDFETDTETLLLNLEAQLAKDSLLAKECMWIS